MCLCSACGCSCAVVVVVVVLRLSLWLWLCCSCGCAAAMAVAVVVLVRALLPATLHSFTTVVCMSLSCVLRGQVLRMCQESGVGAQFGGKYFAHDVRVIRLPRHGASCPGAIMGCAVRGALWCSVM
jgi:tartrate dehydratase alpha subunit/fumarate hydratase class I-like protein